VHARGPGAARSRDARDLRVYSQDDPTFPEGVATADDTSLDVSFALEIDTVPTLLWLEGGAITKRTEVGRASAGRR